MRTGVRTAPIEFFRIDRLEEETIATAADGPAVAETEPAPSGATNRRGDAALLALHHQLNLRTIDPLGDDARQNAASAIHPTSGGGTVHPQNDYLAHKKSMRRRLSWIGAPRVGRDRVYISDFSKRHGDMVARTLAGETSLAYAGSRHDTPRMNLTMNTFPLRGDDLAAYLEPGEAARFEAFGEDVRRLKRDEDGTIDGVVDTYADWYVNDLYEKKAAVGHLREAVEADDDSDKKTFVNLSWGKSGYGAAHAATDFLLKARPGSGVHAETAKLLEDVSLGAPDPANAEQRKHLLDVMLDRMETKLTEPAARDELAVAQHALCEELDQARSRGIAVFAAAGNDFERAALAGHPKMAISSAAGTQNLIEVGAVDVNDPTNPTDDRVGRFSAPGRDGSIDFAMNGVDLPIAPPQGRARWYSETNGTSFAAPTAVETMYAMSAANPELSLDQLESLMERAATDVDGDRRDGAGSVDPFVAVALAIQPDLTGEQLETLRTDLAKLDETTNGRPTTAQQKALRERYRL